MKKFWRRSPIYLVETKITADTCILIACYIIVPMPLNPDLARQEVLKYWKRLILIQPYKVGRYLRRQNGPFFII